MPRPGDDAGPYGLLPRKIIAIFFSLFLTNFASPFNYYSRGGFCFMSELGEREPGPGRTRDNLVFAVMAPSAASKSGRRWTEMAETGQGGAASG